MKRRRRVIRARASVPGHVGIVPPKKPGDVGCDLVASDSARVPPKAELPTRVACGVEVKVPTGSWGLVIGRSSVGARRGLLVLSTVVDESYAGPVDVFLWNMNAQEVVIERGERIAQLVLVPVIWPQVRYVQKLPVTVRGASGVGSTGRK